MVKRCSRCHQTKPWSEFYPARRFPDGTMARPMSRCKHCERARCKARRAADPEKWRKYWRDKMAENRADPERAAVMLAQQRERRGVTPERYRPHRIRFGVLDGAAREKVSAEPFAMWLDAYGGNLAELARMAGVNPRTFWEVRSRLFEGVDIDTVERVLIAAGVTLWEVYPMLYEAA